MRSWQKMVLITIFALFCSKSVHTADNSEITAHIQFYRDFIMKIYTEDKFESCLIYGEVRTSGTLALLLEIIVEDVKKPIIFQNTDLSYEIANLFNSKMLVIAHLENFEMELPMLADALNHMRQKRIIIIGMELDSMSKRLQYLNELFRLCEVKNMINVVVLFVDFPQTKLFYSFTIFPKFQLEEKSLSSRGEQVFPRRMNNLHGYGIRTMPDQLFPFSFAYELDGRIRVGGYLQQLLKTFARSINATLFYPLPVKIGHYDPITVVNMTRDKKLDIPISRLYLLNMQDLYQASKPFYISALCFMTPVKWYHTFENFRGMYLSRLRYLIFSGSFVIYTLLYCCQRLQYKLAGKPCHVSFLGSYMNPNYFACYFELENSVKLPRLVTKRILISLTLIWALCIHTHFTANLNTFVTKPVMVPNPKSWDDLYGVDYKVLFSASFFEYILTVCGDFCKINELSLVFVNTLEEFYHELYKLNTSYAYAVDTFSWKFLKLKMRSLKQPTFHLNDICFRRHLLNSIRLPANSIFKDQLNLFITRNAEHGLDNVWLNSTFVETEIFGKVYVTSHPTEQFERPLDMAYISFMWEMFGIAWTLGTFIFACEVVIGHWQRRGKKNNCNVSK